MCKISDRLRLCTCAQVDREKTKQYWVYSRYKNSADEIEGLIMPPVLLPRNTEQYNIATLEKQLNLGNCFDFKIDPHEKDILDFHFQELFEPDDYLVYRFRYLHGRWRSEPYDAFDMKNETMREGTIEEAFASDEQRSAQ